MNINEILNKYYKIIRENNLDLVIINMKVVISSSGNINVIEDDIGGYLTEKEED